jgi:hypothetical protein
VKLLKNGFQYVFDIGQHVVVPEADDVIPAPFQGSRPFAIRSISFAMLPAIDLDDQFSFERNEVDDISGERNLSLEFNAIKLPCAKFRPQEFFGLSRSLTQLAGARSHGPFPLTLPSPQGGEGHFT